MEVGSQNGILEVGSRKHEVRSRKYAAKSSRFLLTVFDVLLPTSHLLLSF